MSGRNKQRKYTGKGERSQGNAVLVRMHIYMQKCGGMVRRDPPFYLMWGKKKPQVEHHGAFRTRYISPQHPAASKSIEPAVRVGQYSGAAHVAAFLVLLKSILVMSPDSVLDRALLTRRSEEPKPRRKL